MAEKKITRKRYEYAHILVSPQVADQFKQMAKEERKRHTHFLYELLEERKANKKPNFL